MLNIRAVLLASVLVLSAGAAAAQEQPRQYLSINPVGAVFTVYSLEYERAVSQSLTAGLSGTYWGDGGNEVDSGDVSYASLDAKLRFYPSALALRGFSIGGSFGYTRLGGDVGGADVGTVGEPAQTSANALSTGVFIDYNWLLGRNRNFFVGTGLGAKRLWLLDIDDVDGPVAYPTLRLNVGYAF